MLHETKPPSELTPELEAAIVGAILRPLQPGETHRTGNDARQRELYAIVILTTNLDASIDKAFKRRLAAHVVLQHPEEHERALLWERMIAADGAPLARDIDVHALARQFPNMTGANIRNAALAAAFLAAAQRRPAIGHATLVAAARSEYLAMGHVLTSGSL